MGADLDDILNIEEGLNALCFAAGAGHLKMLMYIAMNGDEAMMEMTIGATEKTTPLCLASLGGHTAVVKYLLEEHGEDVEAEIVTLVGESYPLRQFGWWFGDCSISCPTIACCG